MNGQVNSELAGSIVFHMCLAAFLFVIYILLLTKKKYIYAIKLINEKT